MSKLAPIESILPIEEFKKLDAIQEEIYEAWHKRQIFRTETEARYGVLNDLKFPTKAGKYWQSVREQMVHFEELMRLSFEIQRKKLDIEEIEEKMTGEPKQSRTYRRLHIDLNEANFHLKSMEQIAKDRVREIMQWSVIKKEINDGSFDDKNVNTHQKETLFRSVLNRAHASDQSKMSTEEKLSINGILMMLKDEPENKKVLERLHNRIGG